jgi:hypothetical protein
VRELGCDGSGRAQTVSGRGGAVVGKGKGLI